MKWVSFVAGAGLCELAILSGVGAKIVHDPGAEFLFSANAALLALIGVFAIIHAVDT